MDNLYNAILVYCNFKIIIKSNPYSMGLKTQDNLQSSSDNKVITITIKLGILYTVFLMACILISNYLIIWLSDTCYYVYKYKYTSHTACSLMDVWTVLYVYATV